MSIHADTKRGFTLIELLVVVAIIGILSSVVLTGIREARLRAADAAIIQQATQLRNLMEQERTNSGTYVALKNGGNWKPQNACTGFSGQFASQAAEVCRNLVAATSGYCTSNCVYFQTTTPNNSERYSIVAYLPYRSYQEVQNGCVSSCARYLCMGSSGNITTSSDGSAWIESGCIQNP
jgi:prepilin-type N-terminal cleavage/methylation domain-containing protein